MRKLTVRLMGILVIVCVPAWAQAQYPKAEIFGGFSILSFANGDREQAFGWQASLAGNVHRNAGLVADFGGQYKSEEGETLRVHEFLFGPQFNARSDQATGFVHVLLGGARASGGGDSETGFVMGFGGLDVNANNRIAVRVFQFDWLPNRFEGEWSKSEIRFGFGIVIKAGGS